MYEGVVQDLIDELGRLPGVGPKSAQRIAFHLLAADDTDVRRITVTHGDSWGEVVKKQRLLDWAQVTAAPREPGTTSLVVVTRDSPRALSTALAGLCAAMLAAGAWVKIAWLRTTR